MPTHDMGNSSSVAPVKEKSHEVKPVLIPCEFCSKSLDAATIAVHQSSCRPDLLHYGNVSESSKEPKRNSDNLGVKAPTARPADASELEVETSDGVSKSATHCNSSKCIDNETIPCEFCAKLCCVACVAQHQSCCRPDLLHFSFKSKSPKDWGNYVHYEIKNFEVHEVEDDSYKQTDMKKECERTGVVGYCESDSKALERLSTNMPLAVKDAQNLNLKQSNSLDSSPENDFKRSKVSEDRMQPESNAISSQHVNVLNKPSCQRTQMKIADCISSFETIDSSQIRTDNMSQPVALNSTYPLSYKTFNDEAGLEKISLKVELNSQSDMSKILDCCNIKDNQSSSVCKFKNFKDQVLSSRFMDLGEQKSISKISQEISTGVTLSNVQDFNGISTTLSENTSCRSNCDSWETSETAGLKSPKSVNFVDISNERVDLEASKCKSTPQLDSLSDLELDTSDYLLIRSANHENDAMHSDFKAQNVSSELEKNSTISATIPCEFCSKQFYSYFIAEHQSGCRPDLIHFSEDAADMVSCKRNSLIDTSFSIMNSDTSETDTRVILSNHSKNSKTATINNLDHAKEISGTKDSFCSQLHNLKASSELEMNLINEKLDFPRTCDIKDSSSYYSSDLVRSQKKISNKNDSMFQNSCDIKDNSSHGLVVNSEDEMSNAKENLMFSKTCDIENNLCYYSSDLVNSEKSNAKNDSTFSKAYNAEDSSCGPSHDLVNSKDEMNDENLGFQKTCEIENSLHCQPSNLVASSTETSTQNDITFLKSCDTKISSCSLGGGVSSESEMSDTRMNDSMFPKACDSNRSSDFESLEGEIDNVKDDSIFLKTYDTEDSLCLSPGDMVSSEGKVTTTEQLEETLVVKFASIGIQCSDISEIEHNDLGPNRESCVDIICGQCYCNTSIFRTQVILITSLVVLSFFLNLFICFK